MMNYPETKKFQSYMIKECDEVLIKISNIITDTSFSSVFNILNTKLEYRAFCDKIIPNKIGNIFINSVDIDINKKDSIDETLSNSYIRSMNISLYFNGHKFGIDVKTHKILTHNTSHRYDTKYSILGSIRYHEYVDCHYDSRYFPITLSRNPYNIFFLNEDIGVISTIEYIQYYDFKEFSTDYNEWVEDNFLIQKFTI